METTETREYYFRITLSQKEWAELEKYARMEGKDLQQYLFDYFQLGIATAQREGYIYYSFEEREDDVRKGLADQR